MGNNLGRRTLVMDLLRAFLAEMYETRYTAPGAVTAPKTSAAARAFVQHPSTAVFLRGLGDAARDLPTAEAEAHILAALTAFLQQHGLYQVYHSGRRRKIRDSLRSLLKQPDADAVFTRLYRDTRELIIGVLEQATIETPQEDESETEVTRLLQTIGSVLKKYRSHPTAPEWCIDSTVDRITAETVWTLCVLGADRKILKEIRLLAADLYDLLETPFQNLKGGS